MAGYRVRYTLATKLVNELVEAADDKQLTKTINRYGRVDLLCVDALGYMELDRRGAELLFQVLTEGEEKASVAIASNESFSGWTKTFTDPASALPSSTASPSAATSSRPAPTPTASPRPVPPRTDPHRHAPDLPRHRRRHRARRDPPAHRPLAGSRSRASRRLTARLHRPPRLRPGRPPRRLTVQRIRREGQCFICRVADRTHGYSHHIVYEDAGTIVFLNRYPTLLGYCLVSPRKHVEDWARDLSEAEFLAFQGIVHRVARAIAATVPAERIYSLSLGSQQANAHVHWHVAPLPPGVPYEQQEFSALLKDNGILDIPEADQAELARAIRSHL